jgi:hypothetical protein
MDPSIPVIAGSALVLLLYLADILSSRWRLPSVVVLVLLGWMARAALERAGFPPPPLRPYLPTIGLLGLALVVLDGALELRWEPGKGTPALRAAATAVLALGSMTALAGAALRWGEGIPWRSALLDAVPLSIVSSAIAIPSAARLDRADRDHVAVESSLSDILGVLLFNALATPAPSGMSTLLHLGGNAAATAILSVAVCTGLLYLMSRTTHKVRFFPLLAALLLAFSLGKFFHLSSLLLLFVFGLLLAHIPSLPKGAVRSRLLYPGFPRDLRLLETLVRETTFVARTFFFFLFGFTLDLSDLAGPSAWIAGAALLAVVYATRAGSLALAFGSAPRNLVFLAPRGLITILLAESVPLENRSSWLGGGALLIVILGTSLLQVLAGRKVAESAGVAPLLDHLRIPGLGRTP